MIKLVNTFLFYLSISTCAQAFGQTTINSNSNNQSTYEKKYSEIIAADHALQDGDIRKAIFYYSEYLKKNSNNKDVIITLFRLYLAQENYKEASKLLDLYSSKFGQDDVYLAQKAQYLVAVNKSDEARKAMLDQHNYRVGSILVSAKFALQNKNYKKAIQLYQQYLKENPNDKVAMVALIRMQLIHGSVERAEELLSDYLGRFGSDDTYLTEKARYFALTNRPEKALGILGPLIKKDPTNKILLYIEQYALNWQSRKNQEMILTEAKLAVQNNDIKRAMRFYQRYLAKNPNSKEAVVAMIQLYLGQGNLQAVQKMLNTYAAQFNQDNDFLTEKARYLVLTNKLAEALAVLEPLVKKNPNNKVAIKLKQDASTVKAQQDRAALLYRLLTEAKQAIQREDYKKAIVLYQDYLKLIPNDKAVITALIQLQVKQDNPKAVLSLLETYALKFGKDNKYYMEKARYFILINKPEDALTVLATLLYTNPKDKALLELKQYALNLRVRLDVAAREIILANAKKATEEKNYKKAIGLFRFYLSKNPKDKAITLTLINLELQQSNYANAEKLFSSYLKQFGEDSGYLTEKAYYFILMNKPDEALMLLTTLFEKNPSDNTLVYLKQSALDIKMRLEHAALASTLANAKQANKEKNYKKAIALFRIYLGKNPKNKEVTLTLIHLELQQENYENAEKLLAVYENQFGNDSDFLTEKAHYYVLQNKPSEALAILKILLRKNPTDKTLLDLRQYALNIKIHQENAELAAILINAKQANQYKDYKRAVELYELYLHKNPKDKSVLLTLINLEIQRANFARAEKLFYTYKKQFGEDNKYFAERSRYFVLLNKPEEAITILTNLLKANPSDKDLLDLKQYAVNIKIHQENGELVAVLINAKQAIENKNYKKALALYRSYLNKNPKDKEITLTLINLELQQENYTNAEKILALYSMLFGEDKAFLATKARYYVLNKNPEEAIIILTNLLKINPSDQSLLDLKQYALDIKMHLETAALELMLKTAQQATKDKDYSMAVVLYRFYLDKNPSDKTVVLKLIDLELQQENYTNAERLLTAYSAQFGDDDEILTLKAQHLVLTKKPEEALVILDHMLTKDPSNKKLLEMKQYAINNSAYFKNLEENPLSIDVNKLAVNENFRNDELYQQYANINLEEKTALVTLIQSQFLKANLIEVEKLLSEYSDKYGKDTEYLTEEHRYLVFKQSQPLLPVDIDEDSKLVDEAVFASHETLHKQSVAARAKAKLMDETTYNAELANNDIIQSEHADSKAKAKLMDETASNAELAGNDVIQSEQVDSNAKEKVMNETAANAKIAGKDTIQAEHGADSKAKAKVMNEATANAKLAGNDSIRSEHDSEAKNKANLQVADNSATKSQSTSEIKAKSNQTSEIIVDSTAAENAATKSVHTPKDSERAPKDKVEKEHASEAIIKSEVADNAVIKSKHATKAKAEGKQFSETMIESEVADNTETKSKHSSKTKMKSNQLSETNVETKIADNTASKSKIKAKSNPPSETVAESEIVHNTTTKSEHTQKSKRSQPSETITESEIADNTEAKSKHAHKVKAKSNQSSETIEESEIADNTATKSKHAHKTKAKRSQPSETITESEFADNTDTKSKHAYKVKAKSNQSSETIAESEIADNTATKSEHVHKAKAKRSQLSETITESEIADNTDTKSNRAHKAKAKRSQSNETIMESKIADNAEAKSKHAHKIKAKSNQSSETIAESEIADNTATKSEHVHKAKAKRSQPSETIMESEIADNTDTKSKHAHKIKAKSYQSREPIVESGISDNSEMKSKHTHKAKAKRSQSNETIMESEIADNTETKSKHAHKVKTKSNQSNEIIAESEIVDNSTMKSKHSHKAKAKRSQPSETIIESQIADNTAAKSNRAHKDKTERKYSSDTIAESEIADNSITRSKHSFRRVAKANQANEIVSSEKFSHNNITKPRHGFHSKSHKHQTSNKRYNEEIADNAMIPRHAKATRTHSSEKDYSVASRENINSESTVVSRQNNYLVEKNELAEVDHSKTRPHKIRDLMTGKSCHIQPLVKMVMRVSNPSVRYYPAIYHCMRFYIGGQLAYITRNINNKHKLFNVDGDGIGARLLAGLNFNQYFALELGGTIYPNEKINGLDNNSKIHQESLELLGKVSLPLNCNLTLEAKAGEAYLHRHGNILSVNNLAVSDDQRIQKVNFSENSIRPVLGVGLSYAWNSAWSANISYMHLFNESKDSNGVNFYGIGLTFAFK